jgi:hypothetical protein
MEAPAELLDNLPQIIHLFRDDPARLLESRPNSMDLAYSQCPQRVIRVKIAMSALSSAFVNTGHCASDQDPSACRLPASDLQTTGALR